MCTVPRSERGVASTVGTIMTLLVVVAFLTSVSVTYVPVRMKDLEYAHMEEVEATFIALQERLAPGRSGEHGKGPAHFSASVPLRLGSRGIPSLADGAEGLLEVDTSDAASIELSYEFVNRFDNGTVEKVDQDVVLILDSSGSMQWNDPDDLRFQGAADYIGTLSDPDRVAIVDFDHRARLVRVNVGEEPHHLNYAGHGGDPDYQEPMDDLGTIDSWGGTNFGWAMWVANNELINLGDENHTWVEILLTDGWNNYWWYNSWAQSEAVRAKENGILLYTIGLGNHDADLLQWMAEYTGGTYYAAPSAEALRWIYYDISRNFQGGIQCDCTEVTERGGGTVSLEVKNRYFVPQKLSYEGGAVLTGQPDGTVMSSPPDISLSSSPNGGVRLAIGLTSLTGVPIQKRGHGTEVLNLKTLSSFKEEVPLVRTSLQEASETLAALRGELDYWVGEGAAIYESAVALKSEILDIEAWIDTAITAMSLGELEPARNAVQWAMDESDDAVLAIGAQAAIGGIQGWLADSLANAVVGVRCRLNQWMNWAQGVTLRISTTHPEVWGDWLNGTLRSAGADYEMTFQTGGLTVRISAVDVLELRTTVVAVSV
jgi:hypothetical protein